MDYNETVVAVIMYLARTPTTLAEVFQSWDKDGSGSVSAAEFRKAIRFAKPEG